MRFNAFSVLATVLYSCGFLLYLSLDISWPTPPLPPPSFPKDCPAALLSIETYTITHFLFVRIRPDRSRCFGVVQDWWLYIVSMFVCCEWSFWVCLPYLTERMSRGCIQFVLPLIGRQIPQESPCSVRPVSTDSAADVLKAHTWCRTMLAKTDLYECVCVSLLCYLSIDVGSSWWQ